MNKTKERESSFTASLNFDLNERNKSRPIPAWLLENLSLFKSKISISSPNERNNAPPFPSMSSQEQKEKVELRMDKELRVGNSKLTTLPLSLFGTGQFIMLIFKTELMAAEDDEREKTEEEGENSRLVAYSQVM
jgi:hypothetical protein